MNISHKPMILCFVFTLLGSTLAFARPMMGSEDGWRSHGKKRTLVMFRYQNLAQRQAVRVAAY
jgi:hypothetical protein